MDERAYWVVLSMAAGIGPVRFQRLLEVCGGARSAWHAPRPRARRRRPRAPHHRRASVSCARRTTPEAIAAQARAGSDIRALTLLDDDYPANLRQVADPPPVLFVRGQLDASR